MGFWFVLAWLDAGVPSSAMLYAGDEQRCLQIASEHLDGMQRSPSKWIEVVYIGCVQGSRPRGG